MTIGGWIAFGVIAIIVIVICVAICAGEEKQRKITVIAIAAVVIVAVLIGMLWYFNRTASGRRELITQRSNFANGIERTVTVYTANGDIIAQYHGRIDLDSNDGGYVLFDFEGKRYVYYNCFVESIADIP